MMRKSTKIVGIVGFLGVMLLAPTGFAGNVASYCSYGNDNMFADIVPVLYCSIQELKFKWAK